MTDKISQFHIHFEARGGWYDYAASGNQQMFEFALKEWHERMETYQYFEPKFPSAITNWINNPTLNAVASKSNSDYFIGVHAGSLYLINDLFLRMMASPKVLPEIGDVTKEKPTQKIFNPQTDRFY